LTVKWLLGKETGPLKFLDAAERELIESFSELEPHPPMPKELEALAPLEKEFWIKMHPEFPSPYFLEKHPLNRLITLSADELHQVCRYLALFDLYKELQNAVQTRIFKSIKEHLSADELQFLEMLRTIPNSIYLPKMHIGAWDLSKESLDAALFDRGKMRLKGALSSADASLFTFIPKVFLPTEKKPSKEIIELLLKQVEAVLNREFTYATHH